MAIPDYQTLMLPVLKATVDGNEHRIHDVIEQLAREFGLTEEERQQILPSGRQGTFANRVGWAKTYLVQAGLLEATKRAHFKITDRGKDVLAEGPPRIDNGYLLQFSEFIQFKERGKVPGAEPSTTVGETHTVSLQAETPDELLRSTVKQIETALKKTFLIVSLLRPRRFLKVSSSHCSSQWVMEVRGRRPERLLVGLVMVASTV